VAKRNQKKKTHLVENIALALASATADGDDADGTLDELERGDGLRIHPELSFLIGVNESDRPRRTGDRRRRRRARRR